ncbi:phosphoribosylanthranilate isomerase [Pontibacter harenae]|uniref:phosphoribosylanthranilate isomerase n=1 Tax=Pontibacter harenae TaxID=2894083 RepID=UPI001E57B8DF|nr:phosphoribosylanthranilate isomerase [Pontibacter harenae]MCC9167387.1 phosphoribosylanthranilate isomerase [Pontibacter harenae]
MKLKVCGMRQPENIQQVAALQPDYLGFIFFNGSKRDVSASINSAILAELPANIKKVGVFVNEDPAIIKALAAEHGLQVVQLHGGESPSQCLELKEVGLEVVKVFSVGEDFDFSSTEAYEAVCDYFLFDTKGKEHGGNGVVFDWQVLENYTSDKPYFLSGGLNLENIKGINQLKKKPFAIDVNSGFELEPGLKDVTKVQQLVAKLKSKILEG